LAPVLDQKFADYLCKKIEFIPIGFSTAIAGLISNKYMMIGADMHNTPERAKVAAFSTPFNTSGTTYWVDSSGPIKTLEQLNDPAVSIAVITGSDNQTATEKYLPKAHEVLLPNASITDVMLQLQTKKVTAFSNSSFLVPALAAKYPEWLAIPNDTQGLIAQGQGWIFNQNETELLAAANAFMAIEIQSGDLAALTKQYVTLENTLAP
jgi:ABC-type amino acid transport/signal transduction systems, periplasmic component/domain